MNGILNIYKDQGFTSHDIVKKARYILKTKKIGHTGTLDPIAEGVLPLTVGRATKVSQFIVEKDKEYIAGLYLGMKTNTYDRTGEVIEKKDLVVERERLQRALMKFTGDIEQVPPIYSAIKVDGKKLYQYAREGKSVSILPRIVRIASIELLEYKFPDAKIKVRCSKGTYIRSLCNDIGEELNTYGHMTSLIRTKSGPFNVSESIKLKKLEAIVKDEIKNYLYPIDYPLEHFDKIDVRKESEKFLLNGNTLLQKNIYQNINTFVAGEKVRMYLDDVFYGIGRIQVDSVHCIRPVKIFI